MNPDVNDFLRVLENITQNLTYEVFLPHSQITIKLKQLNTQQFNKIITSYATNTLLLNYEIVNILQQNLITKDVHIGNLSIFDFVYLLLNTKKHCLSDDFTVFFTEDEVNSYNLDVKKTYSITEYIKQKEHLLPVPPLVVNIDNISVVCSLPTVLKELQEVNDKNKNDKNDNVYVERLLLIAIVKYIEEINIEGKKCIFADKDLDTNIHIVEQLPAKVITQIIKAIEKLRQPFTELTTLQITSESNIKFEKEIPLSGDLFNY